MTDEQIQLLRQRFDSQFTPANSPFDKSVVDTEILWKLVCKIYDPLMQTAGFMDAPVQLTSSGNRILIAKTYKLETTGVLDSEEAFDLVAGNIRTLITQAVGNGTLYIYWPLFATIAEDNINDEHSYLARFAIDNG